MALTATHPVPTVLFARPPFTAFTCDVTAIEGKSESDYTHPSVLPPLPPVRIEVNSPDPPTDDDDEPDSFSFIP